MEGNLINNMEKENIKTKEVKDNDSRAYIFRPWITKNGKRIYAKTYGIKAFKIYIDECFKRVILL